MNKLNVTNISSVAIVYKKSDPRTICLDIKDAGIPIKLMAGKLCPIGGNWIGNDARHDKGPLDTVRREVGEELSFKRPIRSSDEYAAMGLSDVLECLPTAAPNVAPTAAHEQMLRVLAEHMQESCVPFTSFACTITKAAMDASDPTNTREGFTTLACYHGIGLEDRDWDTLEMLWRRYGNLSNESVTLILSLDDILEHSLQFAFAHDGALRWFFKGMGFLRGELIPSVNGMHSEELGPILPTYADYLEKYNVLKRPS